MSEIATLWVNVEARISGLERDLSKAQRSLERTERAMTTHAKRGSGAMRSLASSAKFAAGAAGIGGLAIALSDSVKEYEESVKAGRQTEAVLKSTGRAANVTKRHVEGLAQAISNKTAIDDEAIQSAENLLLTFTKVRNETGKGNRIFDQATQAITDMSVAMGQDLKSSTIQVGKALNDPIKGMTSLQRVGVTFTAQQRDQIKALEESGQHLKAQKVIIAELNREFGGSAAKAATPLDRLRVSIKNVEESAGRLLAPALNRAAGATATFLNQMQSGTGAGGRFVEKVKELWQNVKPTVAAMAHLAVSVGQFVAHSPAAQKMLAVLIPMGAALHVMGGTSGGLGRVAATLARVAGSAGATGRGAALGFSVLAASFVHLQSTGFFNQTTRLGRIGSVMETTKHSVYGLAEGMASRLVPGGRGVWNALSPLPRLIAKVGGNLRDQLGTVTQVGSAWSEAARQIKRYGVYLGDMSPLDTSPTSPTPAGGARTHRRGGLVFQGGGMVPAAVSSGEQLVFPGGGSMTVPGPRVAADNVRMMLPSGTAVLTGSGQALMARGASLGEAISRQAPHFASGGWVRTGATIDNTRGQAPTYSDHGGMSFAELLEAGANAGMRPDATQLLGLPRKRYGMAMETSVLARMPGSSKSFRIWKNDVGSGQPGNSHYTIDLHGKIARLLGWRPNQDIEIRRDDGSAAPAASGTAHARTVSRMSYAAPGAGTGRPSRSVSDAMAQAGVEDPFGYDAAGRRTDFYNQTKAGLIGQWTRSDFRIPGSPAPRPDTSRLTGGAARAVSAALGEVGHREGAAGNAASFARKYQRSLGHGVESYCGDFVAWAAKQGGAHPTGDWAYVPNFLGNMGGISGHSRRASDARPGDALTMLGNHHVEMVVGKASGNTIPTVGGNTTGGGQGPEGVYRTNRSQWDTIAHVKYRKGGLVGGKARGGFSGLPGRPQNLRAAQDSVGTLLRIGMGPGDRPAANRTYARTLALISRLSAGQATSLRNSAQYMWRRVEGPPKAVQTMRARLQKVIDWAEGQIRNQLTRGVGVADSVEADIEDQTGRLANQQVIRRVDPESAAGMEEQYGLNSRSADRLRARRRVLVTARNRARRRGAAGAADVRTINAEIRDIDTRLEGLTATNIGLRRSINAAGQPDAGAGGETPEQVQAAIRDLLAQQVSNQQKLMALVQSQGPALLSAVTAAVNGDIGGKVGLGFASPSWAGGVQRY